MQKDRLTRLANYILDHAGRAAQEFGHPLTEPIHLLFALIRTCEEEVKTEYTQGIARILRKYRLTSSMTYGQINDLRGINDRAEQGIPPMTESTSHVLDMAANEAARLNTGYTDPKHLLLGLLVYSQDKGAHDDAVKILGAYGSGELLYQAILATIVVDRRALQAHLALMR